VTGRSDPRISDLVLPPGTVLVESARNPALLPCVTVEVGEPVQHHDQAASSLTIELAERPIVAFADEHVEAGQHRVAISSGLHSDRRSADRRDFRCRWPVAVLKRAGRGRGWHPALAATALS
jgi:hypothetical protein